MENADSDAIKPISSHTIHRISSGQVVLNLAIAVKELVENSIDALATSIEVRLREYGTEGIEIVDNGIGVRSDQFQSLTLKHHTSKLREFTDLETISTLGFRGEALSSLCALASMSITTRHSSSDYATTIHYDSNGKITKTSPVAREIGTTVILNDLFLSLPVRRKEFLKNSKREFNKMCDLLYAYCLISSVKITCTNQTKAGKKTIVSTQGTNSIRENIINVFGPNQVTSLIQVDMIEPNEQILSEFSLQSTTSPFTFQFFVSNAIHGNGRSTKDRQFVFVNSRPCELSTILKLINEIYRQFNMNQYPFVCLSIEMKTNLVDVNVTPDKRKLFLENEKMLLAYLKASLLEAFQNCPSTFSLQNSTLSESIQQEKTAPSKGLKRIHSPKMNQTVIEEFVSKKPKPQPQPEVEEESADVIESSLFSTSANLNLSENSNESENASPQKIDESKINQDVLNVNKLLLDDVKTQSKNEICNLIRRNKVQSQSIIKKTQTIHTSISELRKQLESIRNEPKINNETNIKFRSAIKPETNKSAEQELKQINKEDFSEMEIIGQFNLGFIIAKLDQDLFIIDQHAADEKYNFEQLENTTILENQPLVKPKPLELTPSNEILLIDNQQVFEKNGFKFEIDGGAPCTQRVHLTTVPSSKNCYFGKDDIDEMLFMLQNNGNLSTCRPSRIRAMFASRACRKSVMIGSSLTFADMNNIVKHMGEIDQPWNCPHGRPTMRHLINLKLIQ